MGTTSGGQMPPPPANTPPTPEPTSEPKTIPGPHALIVLGLLLAGGALIWGSNIKDAADQALSQDALSCALFSEEGQLDHPACFAEHAPNYAGPIALAVVGAFIILCGVILLAGRRN